MEINQSSRSSPSAMLSWSSWIIAVAAWASHLFFSYSLVEWYCQPTTEFDATFFKILLHGLTLLCFSGALFGVFIANRNRLSLNALKQGKHVQQNSSFPNKYFINQLGIILAGFLAIVIVVQGLPNFVLAPCIN